MLQRTKGKYSVGVTGHNASHNHPLERTTNSLTPRRDASPTMLLKVPQNGFIVVSWIVRCVVRRELQVAYIDCLVTQAGGAKKKIVEYPRDTTGVHVQPKDIENLIAEARKRSRQGRTENERVEVMLTEFCSGPGNVADTFTDKAGFMTCIMIQPVHMRRTAERFPKVLYVSTPHTARTSTGE